MSETEHPYRGTVLVIPDPLPEYIENPLVLVGIVWLVSLLPFFVVLCLP